jgi:ParB-like chromosome segregation protein Spo0J
MNHTPATPAQRELGVAKYEFHALADLFPLVEGAAFEELVADIEEHGLADKIVLHDGKILDGRNRYRAMVQLGFDDHVVRRHSEQFTGTDPLAFVISKNLKRRHLNDDQRRMVGAKIANLRVGANQHTAECGTLTRAKAAELLNTDAAGIERARTVIRTAEPEIQNAVEQGKLTVNLAAQASKLTAEQQREIAAKAEAGEANVVRTVVKKARRAQREVEPQPAKAGITTKTTNSVKPPATPEQTAADDELPLPAPPASSAADDAETDQPATVQQPAEPELTMMPPQAVLDHENGFISSALWEIRHQIDTLPPPAEAVARFPTHHYHTLTAAKLRAMADWLAAFADGWQKNIKEPRNGEGSEAA